MACVLLASSCVCSTIKKSAGALKCYCLVVMFMCMRVGVTYLGFKANRPF